MTSLDLYLTFARSRRPLQPSPIKKDRSPRPQSFCHSSSLSPHDKLSLPGFISQRDKQQRLSYSAFTNQMYSASTDLSSSSPVADGPPLPPRNQGKGQTHLLRQLRRFSLWWNNFRNCCDC